MARTVGLKIEIDIGANSKSSPKIYLAILYLVGGVLGVLLSHEDY